MRSGDRQCMILVLAGLVALAPGAYAADCQDSPCGPSFEHMSSWSYGGSDPWSATARESSATTDGGTTRAQPASRRWPCQLVIDQNLRPFADSAWDGSATFRHQCRTLGAARATVIVTAASPRELDRSLERRRESRCRHRGPFSLVYASASVAMPTSLSSSPTRSSMSWSVSRESTCWWNGASVARGSRCCPGAHSKPGGPSTSDAASCVRCTRPHEGGEQPGRRSGRRSRRSLDPFSSSSKPSR